MEEPTDCQDWEFLDNSDFDENPLPFVEIETASDGGAIRFDYFALSSESHPKEDLGLDNPESFSRVDPDFDSRDQNNPKDDLGIGEIGGIESFHEGVDGFLPENSLESGRLVLEIEKGESFLVEGPKTEVGFDGIEEGLQNSGGIEKSEENEEGKEKEGDLGGDGFDSSLEMSEGSSETVSIGEGEKRELVWWKMPLELLKLCVFRVRPIWCIPIAAAVIGIVMMRRRLYKMKHKSRRIPLKVSIDDKKAASQLLVRAARLNEAVVRRVPIIRSPLLPAGGVTPWPVVGIL